MDKTVFKASEIRYLWKHRGSKNYELKCLKATENFITSIIFEDIRNGREVSGKLVASPREGEAYHWPRLKHENLAPLFDVVSINEEVSVYMSTVLEKSLRDIIHEDEFLRAPNCFERKKSYAEDVLWGLDYLHEKRLCLMNLNDANVFIYSQTDKAVISDFSCLTLAARATKCNVIVPSLYRAPEFNNSSNNFNAVAAEMWACGVMLLQIFTGHAMPETCGNDELLQRVANLHNGVLVEANRGSFITSNAFISFQSFLSLFLCLDPSERCTAKIAAVSPFLRKSWSKTDRRYGKLWQFYVPQTIYSPEEDEFEIQSFCNSPKTLSCSNSSEIDSYRDNLKIHFPWNKFINLNYVSNEQNNSKRDIFQNSLQSNKQNDQETLNNETFDKQINQANSLNFENASTDHYISESNQTANQPFENTNNASEMTRNNFCFETDTDENKLNNVTHLSSLCSSDILDPSTNNDKILLKEISNTEMQNEKTAINNDNFMNITTCENLNEIQESNIKETKKLSPLRYSTGDCIGMFQNETKEKQNEKSFPKDEGSANITSVSKNTNITHKYIVETTNKLSSPSSFSTGDSIGTLRNEIKWDNKEIYYNLLPEIQKSDSDSDEYSQRYESDLEEGSTNPAISESSWFKEEHNRNYLSNAEKIHRIQANPGISKIPLYHFYTNRITEIRKSHSDSTINSSICHSISVKSDPGINRYQSNLSNRTWNSHITDSPDASNAVLVNSTQKHFERIYYAMNSFKSISEEDGIEYFSFSEGCSSFLRNESEQSNTLQKAENSEMTNSVAEDTYSSRKQGLLLSARSLTRQPAFSADNNVGQSLLPNKSETYLEERKPLLSTNYKSEMCLDVRKRAVISQTESLNKGTKFYTSDKTKFDPEMFGIEKCFKNATTKISYTLDSNNIGSLDTETDIFKCNKSNSYACAMMERLDSKPKCETTGCFPYDDTSRSDGITEKQPIFLAAGLSKFDDKESEISEDGIQSINDASSKYEDVDSEETNKNSFQNLGLDKDVEINEMQVESSSFREISLKSTQEPDGKPQQNKNKKKEKRRKSWFHRLCPGCKVYHDDKEELFAGT